MVAADTAMFRFVIFQDRTGTAGKRRPVARGESVAGRGTPTRPATAVQPIPAANTCRAEFDGRVIATTSLPAVSGTELAKTRYGTVG